MRTNAASTIALVCCLAAATPARSAFILSETLTGAQLYSDSRSTFSTRTPVVQGSSLLFDTGTDFAEKLLEFQLVPQNFFNPVDPVIVHIFANLTVKRSSSPSYPADHDPGIGAGDGNIFGGFLAGDNFNGDGGARLYTDLGTSGQGLVYADELFTGTGYPNIGGALTVESKLTLTTASTVIYGAFGGKSGSHTFTETFDLNAQLNFVFFAHDFDERYQLNWITVEVEGTRAVPEPASLTMWGLGAIGIAFIRRIHKQQTLTV